MQKQWEKQDKESRTVIDISKEEEKEYWKIESTVVGTEGATKDCR